VLRGPDTDRMSSSLGKGLSGDFLLSDVDRLSKDILEVQGHSLNGISVPDLGKTYGIAMHNPEEDLLVFLRGQLVSHRKVRRMEGPSLGSWSDFGQLAHENTRDLLANFLSDGVRFLAVLLVDSRDPYQDSLVLLDGGLASPEGLK